VGLKNGCIFAAALGARRMFTESTEARGWEKKAGKKIKIKFL